ncbi:hypothetical protein Q2T42_03760 [Leptolyngbya boryana CZ1]|jgi:hypothetical protein|uniref:Uncharacterized protein n=3 Tax=Leptolyngbya group TaxID=3081713 RepID=A0A1Z4JL54_LEPBY|nr:MULTISPECIES: hypothetical protein [Leptolyngbya]MBD2375167.1 hypothetical protein [Leptolyngbya sp. FACHB-238]MBD2399586.1 hypothetical protein [Leptolyngbya sp. FACHB-239]MBD2405791.1 hypothetical protein [Leptolyngbya sp. FACHB-402]BAS56334.1 hypothetical protein LBWT_22550 [Leptolyngbya boryana IAM M-101]BAY57492.1 hypothetical protein NIES2135_43570 [Leptolyngbya boryana NIES-2135]
MAMMKRWESPRREGRNDKGKGGAARQRQLKKRNQVLRKKLQDGQNNSNSGKSGKEDTTLSPIFYV